MSSSVWEPPGVADLAGSIGDVAPVTVGGRVFHPVVLPAWCVALAAGLVSQDTDDGDRMGYVWRLLHEGLPADEYTTFIGDDAVWLGEHAGDLMAEILCCGTARPYQAVSALCVSAARSWRTIEGQMGMRGVVDPLRAFPSMHSLLNVVESILKDGREAKDIRDIDRKLYRPSSGSRSAGFTSSESAESFDSFAAMAGG